VVETLKEIAEVIGSRPVEEGEFQAAKDALLQGYPLGFETPWQMLNHLGPIIHYGLPHDYLSTYSASITSVTLEDVQRVAVERLSKDGLTLLVVGDKAVIETDLRGIGPEVVVIDGEE
jgi:zinc protease